MDIIRCDLTSRSHQIAMPDTETVEVACRHGQ
jgi:hypothetical protein